MPRLPPHCILLSLLLLAAGARADEGSDPSSEAPRYSADVSDEELAYLFVEEPAALGSISVGYASAGRLMNGVQMPPGDAWIVVSPAQAWGTRDVIEAIGAAATAVRAAHPDVPPLRVNHISNREGGHLRPHRSHQAGRDVDLGFYYKPGVDPRTLKVRRDEAIDVAANWTLIRALITGSDVKVIFVDRSIIRALHEHAREIGEDEAWLDSVFRAGHKSLLQHARRHKDHFHVRFYSPRAQELGRRIQPLLAKVPEQNIVAHRVRRGDTLSHIARRYDSSVKLIQRRNGMRGSFLRVGQVLTVPLRGACTRCPLPPPVVVPPRRLPPDMQAEARLADAAPKGARREAPRVMTFSTRSSVCLAP